MFLLCHTCGCREDASGFWGCIPNYIWYRSMRYPTTVYVLPYRKPYTPICVKQNGPFSLLKQLEDKKNTTKIED